MGILGRERWKLPSTAAIFINWIEAIGVRYVERKGFCGLGAVLGPKNTSVALLSMGNQSY